MPDPDPLSPLDPGRWVSTNDVAIALGFTPRTIRNWIEEGKIPGRKFGREYRIDRAVFEELLNKGGIGAAESQPAFEDEAFTVDQFEPRQ